MTARKTAPEIIGFHLGWDIRDVQEGRYQRYTAPAVYVCGGDYFCCPTGSQKPPKGVSENKWQKVGTYYGRDVWCVSPESDTIRITVLPNKTFRGVLHFEATDYDASSALAEQAIKDGIAVRSNKP